MNIFELMSIISLFFPLFSGVVVGLNTNNMSARCANTITCSFMVVSAIISVFLFYNVVYVKHIIHIKLLSWLEIDALKASFSIYLDSLSVLMFLLVNVISAVVHIYSIGYMSEDLHRQRFMSFLSLFTFFMLILVCSDNLLQLFLGWEGVGLSSFLLISFWFSKSSAVGAAMKAFLINRIADLGLIIAILLIFKEFNSIEYLQIFKQLSNWNGVNFIEVFGMKLNTIDAISIFIVLGCMGKSAQILFHTWLPDAMEGPTPVSALIHAATMVTAGIFLISRCSFIIDKSQLALNLILVVGSITCLFAATIAIVQNDIKKVIAYSTCSQLGYMFFVCGVSGYFAAMFHLATHAFFKALLFLGAGNVIHSLNGEQNIKNMGGLYKKLPYTYIAMVIGSLALIGIFPFSGYFSKDLILDYTYVANVQLKNFAYIMGLSAAVLTAFYSFRMLFYVFHKSDNNYKLHKLPLVMDFPIAVLIFGAIFSGYIGEQVLKINTLDFWGSSSIIFKGFGENLEKLNTITKLYPILAGVLGILIFISIEFLLSKKFISVIDKNIAFIKKMLFNSYYFDGFYRIVFVQNFTRLSTVFSNLLDKTIIDGIPNILAKTAVKISNFSRLIQSGNLYSYSFMIFIGLLIVTYIAIYR